MKRALKVTALLAMGLLVASSFAAAQDAPATHQRRPGDDWRRWASATWPRRSSQEYREIPKGVSIPYVNLFSTSQHARLQPVGLQRPPDRPALHRLVERRLFGLSFDYNQIPHNMGNDAQRDLLRARPGVWGDERHAAAALADDGRHDADRAAGRCRSTTRCWRRPSRPPTASTSRSLRKRGEVELDLGKKLPFDLAFTYMRERKSGYRGAEGGGIYSAINSVVEVPEPARRTHAGLRRAGGLQLQDGQRPRRVQPEHLQQPRRDADDRQPVPGVRRRRTCRRRPRRSAAAAARAGSTRPTTRPAPAALGFLLKFARPDPDRRRRGDGARGRRTRRSTRTRSTRRS